MAISRRSFLKGSGLAAASSLVAPALLGNPFVWPAGLTRMKRALLRSSGSVRAPR